MNYWKIIENIIAVSKLNFKANIAYQYPYMKIYKSKLF